MLLGSCPYPHPHQNQHEHQNQNCHMYESVSNPARKTLPLDLLTCPSLTVNQIRTPRLDQVAHTGDTNDDTSVRTMTHNRLQIGVGYTVVNGETECIDDFVSVGLGVSFGYH